MKPSELKYNVAQTGSHFFDRKTLKFFGDSMSNYGVRSAVVINHSGEEVGCWELYRHRAVKHGLKTSAYFDKVTFKQVHVALRCGLARV